MKKIYVTILSLLLIPQLAFASQASNFKNLIDEHRYFLTVEWDQVNQEELALQNKSFRDAFEALLDDGLSDQDIASVMEISESSLLELQTINTTDSEAIVEFMNRNLPFQKGASWNGDIVGPAIILGLAALGLTLFISYAIKKNKAFDNCVASNNGNVDACIEY